MKYEKTLRWLNPSTWIDTDTSLCNRLLHWEIAYELNKKNNFKFQIILDDYHWREYNLIYLPNTSIFPYTKNNIGSEIDIDMINDMFNTNFFDLNGDHWYSNFGYKSLSTFYNDNTFSPISLVRLANPYIEDFIKTKMKNVVGIHIRRNVGVFYTNDDVNTLPKDLQEKYINLRNLVKDYDIGYKFIPDDYYFKIIDNMLKINPHQKFFISTDLPYTFILYYKEKYGKNIITKEDFISNILYYLNYSGLNIESIKVLDDVVDLFSLSFCKFLIQSNISTWSEFAKRYRNQPSVLVTDEWEKIEQKYMNNDWDQSCDFNFYKKNIKIII